MERLTRKDSYGHWYTNERVYDRFPTSEPYPHAFDGKPIDRLAYYEDLEEQGRLVVLPCKVGDTFFDVSEFVNGDEYPEMYEDKVRYIELQKDRETGELVFCIEGIDFRYDDFGKTVFLTREEAEAALKKEGENG